MPEVIDPNGRTGVLSSQAAFGSPREDTASGDRPSHFQGRGQDHGKRGPGRRPMGRPDIPKKVVEVTFYPEDHGFKALCKALRISTITYELFDIARTILEKDERFYMMLRPVEETASGETSPEAFLYVSEADGIPFLDEASARQHALGDCLDHFSLRKPKK